MIALGSTGERRQVCVMFCDIVGFTALSARLDPEDLSAVIRGYQSRAAETITPLRRLHRPLCG